VTEVFSQTIVADTEYEIEPGNLPNLLCLVAYVLDENLRHVHTIRMWREQLFALRAAPFDVGLDTVFIAYNTSAELKCFLTRGWPFPVHVYDPYIAYRAESNLLLPYEPEEKRTKPRRRLSDACKAYGIKGWETLDKVTIAEDIGNGRWQKYGREGVLDYCEEDVRNTAELLRRQIRGYGPFAPVNAERVLHWSNYSGKAVALIEARGIPIDVKLWDLVQENKAAVIGELLRQFDPSYGSDDSIYTSEGEWSYERFERWLVRSGIPFWPRLESGQLDSDSDAFRLMASYPGVENLHALRDSIGFIAKARLPIGRDGRNRPTLFPFGTATGRNAHSKSPYNAHAGVRGFMVFSPDRIGAYLDWRTQEVGVAAVRAGDAALMADYRRGDVYHALARLCGLTDDPDPEHWKRHNPDVRQRMKPLQLGINYGMGVPSLARGLNRHPLIASGIIERHRQTYPNFWRWREEEVLSAMLARRIESSFGWPLHLTTSPNKRTLYNFPMQADGAEMLRIAAWRLCEAGIVPVMLIHDGILFEALNSEQVEHAKEIMRHAGRDVCDGFEIGVDVDQKLAAGTRYSDKRPIAKKMWATIMAALEAARAIPRRA
jgi:DNA polymerase family A